MADQKLCTVCGAVGNTKRHMKGSLLTELFLGCFFLIPGLIYSIWRHTTVAQVCRNCGSPAVIPLSSPFAQQTLAARGTTPGQVLSPRPSEPSATKPSATKVMGVLVAALVLLVVVLASISTNSGHPNPNAASTPNRSISAAEQTKTLPASDQSYVRASLQYLGSANAGGTQLATIWAGASSGASTLDDCHAATSNALAQEKARFATYRATRGVVPAAFAEMDKHIVDIHKKSIGGLESILSYWANGDLTSVSRGMDQYKAAIVEMNSTIAEGTAAMKREAR